uniref:DDE Tnp4 domain-containing protein n=1 Tax=Salmo trutta TaxID=8032 RepID=A0A674AUD6_SALTR
AYIKPGQRQYKENTADIICLLEPRLSADSFQGRPIHPSLQILITLRFSASGTFHRETRDLCGVNETTVYRVVHKVCNAICELKYNFIMFPDAAAEVNYKVEFYEYGNFPGVIGYAEEYRNLQNWFSINFSNIAACWKGATHNSRTFQNSSLYAQLEGGQHSGIILGDSGYAQTNFLFTPYLQAIGPEQQWYNQAHIRPRGVVERMFGVWKSRFQCLRKTLHFQPKRCCIVIIATAVLPNYPKQHGCTDPRIEDEDDPDVPMVEANDNKNGQACRDAFAMHHFSRQR